MNEERLVEALTIHTEELIGQPKDSSPLALTKEERGQLAPLFQLAEQLHQYMYPVQPSADFVRSLGQELTDNARRQVALSRRLRRAVLIGAAALGSLLSIASVVGAIVFVIVRLRTRSRPVEASVS
ncbi:MAG: hypothetical protein DRI48_10905 [Chloroflexi bacterium]|nr:MAG: hypothetical protein DRI48_10905 [Chloroflexota bacterium]